MTKKYLGESKEIEVLGEKVTLGQYSYAVQKKITQLTTDGKQIEAVDTFLESTITDWSLTNEKNEKLAINGSVFDTLSSAFITKVLEEAIKLNNLNEDTIKNLSGRLEPQLPKQV